MQVVLNEYTLALLCGGISCLTYFLTSGLAAASTGKTVRIKDESKRKSRKPILKASNSETNDSVDDEEDDDDEAEVDEQVGNELRVVFYCDRFPFDTLDKCNL